MSAVLKFYSSGLKQLEDKAELFITTVAENVRVEAKILVNKDTHKLKHSISVMEGLDKFEKYIGSDVKYALWQEQGNAQLTKIPSYSPYLKPALYRVVYQI